MVFDILFVVAIGLGFWWGYQKGIIYSLFSLAAYFIGIIAALKFSYVLVKFLQGTISIGPRGIAIVAFVLVFILIVLLVRLIAWVLEQILKSFSLNLVNQLIGGVIFSLISLYILCVGIWFLNKWDIIPAKQKMNSHVYPYIWNIAPAVVEYSGKVVPMVRTSFDDLEEAMKSES